MNTPEPGSSQWKRLDELLDAVMDLPQDQRSAFLDHACAGNDALRKEIDKLLHFDEAGSSFIQSPAFQVLNPQTSSVTSLLNDRPQRTPLPQPGKLIAGRYEILSKLGKGGMGEVWHAYDVKLRVDVALKALRRDFKAGEDSLEFFRHEVRIAREVVSSNVCRIFDLVSVDDHELISMEHIDGITLMEMLEQKGPLELKDARDIAAQFLSGLGAIHDVGLVHRDIKPENIMITRAGRVVVMDLGIAQPQAKAAGMISGTIPYMSPEQLAGEAVDARSDIFSAGVVLSEIIYTKGGASKETRELVWKAVRNDPMQLPESAWKEVIARAVAEDRANRFESAAALAHALEEITLRAERSENRIPYPGLASFVSGDSDYFFGRELEVETLIKKLQQLHLLALIGPSGAGKTSFLQAGLIPSLPEEWGCLLMQPGSDPATHLQTALASLFSNDEGATTKLIRTEDPDEAIRVLKRLRQKYAEFVLIVDRFEELFTLSSSEAQSRFAEFLERLTLEANIRILIAMRDDFFISCKAHPPLAPIFSEITVMAPITGAALRRALVQPALKCGYRFEDEALVHEILLDVEKERGALPLLAFAASLLWEKRDRQKGLLTRTAYAEIGGVRGALAQHAENTMHQIGMEKEPIVREIFRNLITAQKTRVSVHNEELLSVFPDKQEIEKVLRTLTDARLLTSSENRIEITHESLISNWPRLIRWQAQDAESAQLRDDLRQAAQLWSQRGRTQDLLWTGAAFLEFQLWRQRYAGGLTATEEAFAQAMAENANKKRRRRQITVAALLAILFTCVIVIGNFWRKEAVARKAAIAESKRAEAGKLMVLGRSQPAENRSARLAYALASLKTFDTPQARRFANQVLSEGPVSWEMETKEHLAVYSFSPDNQWILGLQGRTDVYLISRDGSTRIRLPENMTGPPFFSGNGKFLVGRSRDKQSVLIWSIAEKKIVRTLNLKGNTWPRVARDSVLLITDLNRDAPQSDAIIRILRFDRPEPEVIGHWRNVEKVGYVFINPQGDLIIYSKPDGVYVRSVQSSGLGTEKLVAETITQASNFTIHPYKPEVAISNQDEIQFYSLIPGVKNPIRIISATTQKWDSFDFDPTGNFFVASGTEVYLWNLNAPQGSEPMVFRHARGETADGAIFDSNGRWLVLSWEASVEFIPLTHIQPSVIRGKGEGSFNGSFNIRFSPDGKFIVCGMVSEGIRLWNTPKSDQAFTRTVWKPPSGTIQAIEIDPAGNFAIAGTNNWKGAEGAYLISIKDGRAVPLKRALPRRIYDGVSISPDGKYAVGVALHGPSELHGIEIWELQSGDVRVPEKSKDKASFCVRYAPDGSLFSGDADGNLYQWNLKNDSYRVWKIGQGLVTGIAITNDARYVAAASLSVKKFGEITGSNSELIVLDLKENKINQIQSHGNRVFSVAFDPSGKKLVTGDLDGIVRVGSSMGDTPHLLIGHQNHVADVTVDPSGKWIASAEFNQPVVRLWPMPEGIPIQAQTYDGLLTWLQSLTNVRAVADNKSPDGYRIEIETFPDWTKSPSW